MDPRKRSDLSEPTTKKTNADTTPKKTGVFLQPIPDIQTEAEYNKLITSLNKPTRRRTHAFNPKKKRKNHDSFKLKFRYREDKDFGLEDYKKHLSTLNINLRLHKSNFRRSNKKRGVEVKVKEINSTPKNADELKNIRSIIGKLKSTDELFINAHGNMNFIGNGCLAMNAREIAVNLKKLGLSKEKDKLPAIRIWACNSGVSDAELKSLAECTKNALVKLGYETASVSGIKGYLYADSDGTKVKELQLDKIVPAKSPIATYPTPPPKDKHDKKDGIYTVLAKNAEGRRIIPQAETPKKETNEHKTFSRPLARTLFSPEPKSTGPAAARKKPGPGLL